MMNERIRELWNKAAESTAAYPSGQNNSWETQVNFMDKFAELIVRECGQLALDEQQRYRNISHRDMIECAVAMSNYQLLLKEHFGVEE